MTPRYGSPGLTDATNDVERPSAGSRSERAILSQRRPEPVVQRERRRERGRRFGQSVFRERRPQQCAEIMLVGWRGHPKPDRARVDPTHVHVPEIAEGARAQPDVELRNVSGLPGRRSGERRGEILNGAAAVIRRLQALLRRMHNHRERGAGVPGRIAVGVNPERSEAAGIVERRQLCTLLRRDRSRRRSASADGGPDGARHLGEGQLNGRNVCARDDGGIQ